MTAYNDEDENLMGWRRPTDQKALEELRADLERLSKETNSFGGTSIVVPRSLFLRALAALPPSPAVATKEAPFAVFGQEAIDAAMENERTAQQFRDDLVASPSPPALDGAGREREGWQPIETAPKDGTEFLAICAKAKNRDMAHFDGYISVDHWHHAANGDGFDGPGSFNSRNWPATHWRPLPAPPKETP